MSDTESPKGIRLPLRVRFVGGCWHNELHLMAKLPQTVTTADGVHTYFLATFFTKYFATPYIQYLHESMINFAEGTFSAASCKEWFPPWRINERKLAAQIRVRMQGKTRVIGQG